MVAQGGEVLGHGDAHRPGARERGGLPGPPGSHPAGPGGWRAGYRRRGPPAALAAGLVLGALLGGCRPDRTLQDAPPEATVPAAGDAGATTGGRPVPERGRLGPAAGGPPGRDSEEAREVADRIAALRGVTDAKELADGLWELGWIGHPLAIDFLAGLLSDPRERVVDAAVGALEDIGGPEAARAMGRAFALEGHEAVKLRAVEGLHYLRHEAPDVVVEALIGALSDPSPAVRRDARLALAHFAGPRVIARLWQSYGEESTDETARSELATLLRDLGETSLPAAPAGP